LDGFEGDAPAVEDSLSNAEVRETLMSLLGRLKERERIAVENRFGLTAAAEPRTLKDLAGQWGVTKQRAQQVCAGAVNKLRSMLQDAGFEADVA
jgi:DNA-directed RNA polymerase sigma subunit (sigma70/sigma32)